MLALLCGWQSACAATGTIAWGNPARAAIYAPPAQACAPQAAPGAVITVKPAGERKTVREERDGKVGPDDVVTTTTTEPAFAPAVEPVPVQESRGAAISAGGKSLLGSLFGALKAIGCVATLGAACGL